MKGLFRDRTLGAYFSLGAACLGLLTAIVYLIYSVSVKLFAPVVFVLLLLGAIVGAVAFVTRERTLPLVATACYAFSFALHISDRALMFAHMATNVYGMSERGAILWVVVLLLILQCIVVIASVISCFMKQRNAS